MSDPAQEGRVWTIYNAPDWDDSIFGPSTGKDGERVVPESALRESEERAEAALAQSHRDHLAEVTRAQEAEARVARLREALERIRDIEPPCTIVTLKAIARAALPEGEE